MGGDGGAQNSGESQHDEHAPTAEQGSMNVDSQAIPVPEHTVPTGPNASSGVADSSPDAVDGSAPAASTSPVTPGIPAHADPASSIPQSTDTPANGDAQMSTESTTVAIPLQPTDSLATLPDAADQSQSLQREDTISASEQTQPVDGSQYQGDDRVPATDPYAPDPSSSQASKGSRVASANRLSAAYAAGTRRMVIDAEIVESLKVYRAEARIEVLMTVEKDEAGGYKGIMVRAGMATHFPSRTDACVIDGSIFGDCRIVSPS